MKRLFLSLFFVLFAFPALAANFLDLKEVKIGQPVSDFALPDLQGNSVKLSDFKGKVIFLNFWSAECPFVLRYESRLQELAKDYGSKGVIFLNVDSNKSETLDQIRKISGERSINHPILIDAGNKIADRFGAITTPHVFILDKEGNLAYEGAVDDQGWDENNKPKVSYAREALDALLAGGSVPVAQTKTVGCTVKRK